MEIVEATLDHVKDAADLFEQYRLFYKLEPAPEASLAFMRERLLAKDSDIFLAYDGEQCTGFMQLYRCWDSLSMKKLLFLYDLFVIPEERNKKIGDQLIERAKKLAADIDVAMIMLQTHRLNNTYARRFYENNGFELDDEFDVYNFSVE
jgi:GNAT superfamily N-acetyltransferase